MLLVVVALAPLWLSGMFGRALWTPDEPREADIAWRMSQQADRLVPQLAGTPFLEKPPLSYWLSATGIALFGDHPGSARAPNLLYACVTALAVALLALECGLSRPGALVAALVAGSALSAWRVQSWLAPDAALLAGNALALLGLWRGYRAPRGWPKAAGYALMHLGAALGFMAKSAPGWLVPGLAFAVLIAWERRWRELLCWELYAGFLLQVALIGPWLWALALRPDAATVLRTLFWNNLAGRFAHIDAPAALDYAAGHPNSPGKYLLELPLYLLPWTLIVFAALRRAWRACRAGGAQAGPWRFALAASVPFMLLLSAAATARDIYAAPALLGFALLAGLWLGSAPPALDRLDSLCLRGTRWLVAALVTLLVATLALFVRAGCSAAAPALTAGLLLSVAGVLLLNAAASAQARGAIARSLFCCYGAYAVALVLAAFVIFPVIDRWQDLGTLAQAVRRDTREQRLALLAPDETTLAVIDHAGTGRYAVLNERDAASVRAWFAARGPAARVLVLLPGHAPGQLTDYLAHWRRLPPLDDGFAGTLVARGAAVLERRYELPQGRRYALLAPPR